MFYQKTVFFCNFYLDFLLYTFCSKFQAGAFFFLHMGSTPSTTHVRDVGWLVTQESGSEVEGGVSFQRGGIFSWDQSDVLSFRERGRGQEGGGRWRVFFFFRRIQESTLTRKLPGNPSKSARKKRSGLRAAESCTTA